MNYISLAIEKAGLQPLAKKCGVSYQAIRRWEKQGLPRSEWSGDSNYAAKIVKATKGAVTYDELVPDKRKGRVKN